MNTLERYDELFEMMSESGDIEKMKTFGKAERWAFELMSRSNPSVAREWLDRIESVAWNNYLSESEAAYIVTNLIDRNGRTGQVWSVREVEQVADTAGIPMELPPCYNRFALWTTMNMLATDHLGTATAFVGDDAPKLLLQMSVDKLKDPDRPDFVRPYFGL